METVNGIRKGDYGKRGLVMRALKAENCRRMRRAECATNRLEESEEERMRRVERKEKGMNGEGRGRELFVTKSIIESTFADCSKH